MDPCLTRLVLAQGLSFICLYCTGPPEVCMQGLRKITNEIGEYACIENEMYFWRDMELSLCTEGECGMKEPAHAVPDLYVLI